MAQAKQKAQIKWHGKLFYGSGNLGFSIVSQTMSSFIMFFGTAVCGLSPLLMGIAIGVGCVFDAITDPIVGAMSDGFRSKRFGKRHAFLLVSTFLLVIFNIVLFGIPYQKMSQLTIFIYFLFAIMLQEGASTLFATPYVALGMELTKNYNEQTVLQSYKTVFFLIGMVLPTVLMAVLQASHGQLDAASYRMMSYINSGFALIFGLVCFFGTKKYIPMLLKNQQNDGGNNGNGSTKKKYSKLFASFFKIFAKRHYRYMVLGYAVSLISAAFLTGVGFHMFTYSFNMQSTNMYILLFCMLSMSIFSQPLWVFLSKKWNKKRALIFGLLVSIAGATLVGVVFLVRSLLSVNAVFYILIVPLFLIGVGTGAMYSLPPSMLADSIAYEKNSDKRDRTATYSGVMTFSYKVAQSLTMLLIGLILQLLGFNEKAAITPLVSWGLGITLVLGVIISLAAACILYSKYDLTRDDFAKIQDDNKITNGDI